MGNLKKLSAKEIAALKGKDGLFDGEVSDLQTGMKVKVVLLRNRTQPKPKGRDDAAAPEEDKLFASKVIVLAQAAPKQ